MRKGAIVVGSLAALAFLSALGIAFAKASSGAPEGTALPTADTVLEWLNAALGIPSSVQTTTGTSGRSYQIATWKVSGKEAVLVTSLSPKTVYAIERDEQDRVPQVLVELLPDDIAKTEVAKLVHSF